MLLNAGADPNICARDMHYPIHGGAGHDNLDIAKVLIEHGADVNVTDQLGETPLTVAKNNPEMKALLRQAGAKD